MTHHGVWSSSFIADCCETPQATATPSTHIATQYTIPISSPRQRHQSDHKTNSQPALGHTFPDESIVITDRRFTTNNQKCLWTVIGCFFE